MAKLLLIADDFTGALDTGIQFAEYGATTKMLTSADAEEELLSNRQIEVLVIDAETRHLSAQEAYERVFRLVRRARQAGVSCIYKKTDSALRGNIGSELQAVLDASGDRFLPFVPALPSMNRITRQGVHYIGGVPIHQTEFGQDLLEPVRSPRVADLFQGTRAQIRLLPLTERYRTEAAEPTVGIFDADSDEAIGRIAAHLNRCGQLRVMAGCAGFAAVLPLYLQIQKKKSVFPRLAQPLLVVCGSVNPVTRRQIEYGESLGYKRVVMTPRQQLEAGYFDSAEGKAWLAGFSDYFRESRVVMIDTGISNQEAVEEYKQRHHITTKEAGRRIADRIGYVLRELLRRNRERTLMIIGGDTLMSFVSKAKCREIEPVCEVEPGTVLSSMQIEDGRIWVISKSGGFGEENLLRTVAEKVEALC